MPPPGVYASPRSRSRRRKERSHMRKLEKIEREVLSAMRQGRLNTVPRGKENRSTGPAGSCAAANGVLRASNAWLRNWMTTGKSKVPAGMPILVSVSPGIPSSLASAGLTVEFSSGGFGISGEVQMDIDFSTERRSAFVAMRTEGEFSPMPYAGAVRDTCCVVTETVPTTPAVRARVAVRRSTDSARSHFPVKGAPAAIVRAATGANL
mmetsp:Transcript_54022/g.128388  ORF Transcript_54022/g.128388 Transcript_54022/m.128388 type:complete len:208 (+) Transcript_54022:1505-2128(+)